MRARRHPAQGPTTAAARTRKPVPPPRAREQAVGAAAALEADEGEARHAKARLGRGALGHAEEGAKCLGKQEGSMILGLERGGEHAERSHDPLAHRPLRVIQRVEEVFLILLAHVINCLPVEQQRCGFARTATARGRSACMQPFHRRGLGTCMQPLHHLNVCMQRLDEREPRRRRERQHALTVAHDGAKVATLLCHPERHRPKLVVRAELTRTPACRQRGGRGACKAAEHR